jgi:hypothetical protein
MAMAEPVYSLKHFQSLIEDPEPYPFYGVMLYTPTNGMDQRIPEYVLSRWHYLNRLTGDTCLLFAVEDVGRNQDISEFRPEEIYDIARQLWTPKGGVELNDMPCIVFFTDPLHRNDTLVLRLAKFLPAPKELTDEDLTDFFRSLATIMDQCSVTSEDERLVCLHDGLSNRWPSESTWFERATQTGSWIVNATAGAASVATAIATVIAKLAPLFR